MPNSTSKDGGKSNHSWHKHNLVRQLAYPQAVRLALSVVERGIPPRGAIVDMHAGDGQGAMHPELGMSRNTAQQAVEISEMVGNCEAFLCEGNPRRRDALSKLVLNARTRVTVTRTHDELAKKLINSLANWVLVLNDPCGPSDHGMEVVREIAKEFKRVEFVIVFNEGWIQTRLPGFKPPSENDSTQMASLKANIPFYQQMLEPEWWMKATGCSLLLRSLIKGHYNFTYRVMLCANELAPATKELCKSSDWELVEKSTSENIPQSDLIRS